MALEVIWVDVGDGLQFATFSGWRAGTVEAVAV